MDLTRRAHDLIRNHFEGMDKKMSVDATCGNGFDTVFLASLGFEEIIAFDVQTQAIRNTQTRLRLLGHDTVKLINDGHENLEKHINSPVDCFIFNFGYMPNLEHNGITNKRITTQTQTSLNALKAALRHLSKTGLISLMCYPGHPQGADETKAIQHWLSKISSSYNVETHLAKSPKPTAPILYVIRH